MRKVYILIFLTLFGIITGCSKLQSLTNIEVDIPYNMQTDPYNIVDSTIHIPGGGQYFVLPSFPITTNSKQFLTQYNTSTAKINSVKLTNLSMNIIQPTNGNFNFIKKVEVYIYATGLPKIKVAANEDIGTNINSVTLTDTSADLKSYFLSDTMYLQMSAYFTEPPAPHTQINVNATMHLSANPLN